MLHYLGTGEVYRVDAVYSHNIDESGVESVTLKEIGYGSSGNSTTTYVVDNKKRPLEGGNYYRARCDLQTAKSGYRVFRITSFDKQGSLTGMLDRFTTGNGLLYTQGYNNRLERYRDMSVKGKVK